MIWEEKLNELTIFTTKEKIEEILGKLKFQLNKLPIYYLGNGFFLGFLNRKFKIENGKRIELNETGEFLSRIYFFKNINDAKSFFRIKSDNFQFETELITEDFQIVDEIKTNHNFEIIKNILTKKNSDFIESEDRVLNETQKFVFQNKWIGWGGYRFIFFGKSKKTLLSAFEYNLK